jgi:hypothetical protein
MLAEVAKVLLRKGELLNYMHDVLEQTEYLTER